MTFALGFLRSRPIRRESDCPHPRFHMRAGVQGQRLENNFRLLMDFLEKTL